MGVDFEISETELSRFPQLENAGISTMIQHLKLLFPIIQHILFLER